MLDQPDDTRDLAALFRSLGNSLRLAGLELALYGARLDAIISDTEVQQRVRFAALQPFKLQDTSPN